MCLILFGIVDLTYLGWQNHRPTFWYCNMWSMNIGHGSSAEKKQPLHLACHIFPISLTSLSHTCLTPLPQASKEMLSNNSCNPGPGFNSTCVTCPSQTSLSHPSHMQIMLSEESHIACGHSLHFPHHMEVHDQGCIPDHTTSKNCYQMTPILHLNTHAMHFMCHMFPLSHTPFHSPENSCQMTPNLCLCHIPLSHTLHHIALKNSCQMTPNLCLCHIPLSHALCHIALKNGCQMTPNLCLCDMAMSHTPVTYPLSRSPEK
jgi:hypothetical protein